MASVVRGITLDVEPALSYAALLEQAPEIAREELGIGLETAAALYMREVKDITPVGVTGNLRESIAQERADTPEDVQVRVFSPLNYAAPVELGTKPHYPPLAALEDWVRAKLSVDETEVTDVAQKIQWKIGKKGTKPRLMFTNTLDEIRIQMREEMRQAVDRAWDRLRGGGAQP
ncbi:MAG: hypothetical protein GC151_13920 [Betaproteobacteria bacterium]|nr:hypothetical protein [Betaproteobacteria bacterium]